MISLIEVMLEESVMAVNTTRIISAITNAAPDWLCKSSLFFVIIFAP
jgi:hypothetical protein